MTLSNDAWRSIQIYRNLSNPQSFFNRFGCGSAETLKSENLREKLLDFNKKYYSSNLMKLCVYGNEPLDVLEKWVSELFSSVKNYSVPNRDLNKYPKPFEIGKNMKQIIEIVPIKDKDVLELIWVVDENLHNYYKTKPEHLIAHLFGHEGTNSLLSLLKEEDLATALMHGLDNELDSFSTFNIRIELTRKGLERYEDVCEIVFCYLKKLKEKQLEDWKLLYEECSKIEELSFLFEDKIKEIRYVTYLANNMHIYPVENLIDGAILLEKFDFELIMKILNSFTIDNLIIFFFSKSFEGKTSNIEKYFKTPFNCSEMPKTLIEKFHKPQLNMIHSKKILDFPLKNNFIPQNFAVIPDEKIWSEPRKIYETEQSLMWLKQGSSFKLPKSIIGLKIYTDG